MAEKKKEQRFQSGTEVLEHYIPDYVRQIKQRPLTVRSWEYRLSARAVAREILNDFVDKLAKIDLAGE